MAAADQVGAQLLVVVNYAVEYHPNGLVFVTNRLVARAEVDDTEPPHADPAPAVQVIAFVIWPAMANLIAHPADVSQLGLPIAQKLSSDAAHRSQAAIGNRSRSHSLIRLSQFETVGLAR